MGKTRLALQVGADLLDRFEDGVFVIPLDTLHDPSLVPAAIVKVLGLREDADTSLATTLSDYLRNRHLLLVLDNLEQVIDAAAFIGELVAACPRLKIIATSRIRLQLRSEHEYPVPPLDLPDSERAVDARTMSQYESVRLFIERAEAVKPNFSVTNQNAPAVAEICTRLDGLPLAIELAAARVRMLPPEAMLRKLTNRLPLLTGGARDLPVRQRTLRGAIAWSYELLSPDDQALFRRMSVFAGGSSLEAIEAVVADEGQGWEAFDGLERLVDQSLVRQSEIDGDPRFSMFETIREYGMEELERRGEAAEARARHAAFFAELAAQYDWEFTTNELAAWLDRMEVEHDNVRAAAAWAIVHAPPLAVRLIGFAGRFWYWRGHLVEGKGWAERFVVIDDLPDIPREDRARALRTALVFLSDSGGHPKRWEWIDEVDRLYRKLGDMRQVSFGLSMKAFMIMEEGDHQRGLALSQESVDLARSIGDPFALCWCLNNAANQAYLLEDLDSAATWAEEALELARQVPSMYASTVIGTAADISRLRGEIDRAERLHAESLAEAWVGGLIVLMSGGLMGLVMTAAATGRWERAARLGGAEAALRHVTDFSSDPELAEMADEYDRVIAQVRDALGREAFDLAWAAGAALSVEEAVAEARMHAGNMPAGDEVGSVTE
jgi:predicted ATPase